VVADGFAQLDAQIERLRSLGTLVQDAAPEIAEVCKEKLDSQIASGKGPDGQSWALRQDGGQPLQNAANAVNVAAVGSTIIMTVKGPEARHHKGTALGGVVRQILPSRDLPGPLAEAIKDVVVEKFKSKTRGQ
jgi:hypothetical protein